jgi:peptidyl-prolyl cis-trans isomerase C
MPRRKIVCFYIAMVLLVSAAHTVASASEIAKVDDTVISSESVTAALKALGPQGQMVAANPELRKRFVDHMINSLLVSQKAKAEGFDKNPQFQARLADVTAQLLAGEYMDQLVAKKSSEKEQKAWFEANKQLFSKKEVHAMHILCSDEATAKKALEEVLKSPTNFETIAKKYSKDKTIDLGFFGHGRMVPEFEKVAFSTPLGTVSPSTVKTQFGWHVIKVLESRGDDEVAYDKVKQDVSRKYRAKLQEDLVHDLREKSKIAINEKSLKDIKLP